MNSIMVKEHNGMYEVNPNAEVEDWNYVKKHGHVKRQEGLLGWGKYTAAYTLAMPHETAWYFVAE